MSRDFPTSPPPQRTPSRETTGRFQSADLGLAPIHVVRLPYSRPQVAFRCLIRRVKDGFKRLLWALLSTTPSTAIAYPIGNSSSIYLTRSSRLNSSRNFN